MRINRTHRVGAAGLVAAAALAAASVAASAPAASPVPAPPRIAFISSAELGPCGHCAPNAPLKHGGISNELRVVNADGSGQRTVARHAGLATPTWSPDARRIAYQSGWRVAGLPAIHVVGADGTSDTLVARGFGPTWSPVDDKLAFASRRDGNSDVYVVNADGSGERNLTTRHPADDRYPVWSPDGRKVAFVTDRAWSRQWLTGTCLCYLAVVNADGSGLRSLTRDPAYAVSPDWSVDGRTIRFARSVVNADGSGLQTARRYMSMAGVRSPDGRKVAFVRASDRGSPRANYDVYVMNADGSGAQRLTHTRAYDGDPAWSPDGRWIAFRSTRDGNPELYVMKPNGTGQRRLTHSPANEGWFVWSPAR